MVEDKGSVGQLLRVVEYRPKSNADLVKGNDLLAKIETQQRKIDTLQETQQGKMKNPPGTAFSSGTLSEFVKSENSSLSISLSPFPVMTEAEMLLK